MNDAHGGEDRVLDRGLGGTHHGYGGGVGAAVGVTNGSDELDGGLNEK
jgi:hypothetical protein